MPAAPSDASSPNPYLAPRSAPLPADVAQRVAFWRMVGRLGGMTMFASLAALCYGLVRLQYLFDGAMWWIRASVAVFGAGFLAGLVSFGAIYLLVRRRASAVRSVPFAQIDSDA